MAQHVGRYVPLHLESQPMMAELVDWLDVSVIKHVWSATSFLSLDDLYRDIAEWANANAGFGIVQRYDVALKITFRPTEVFRLAASKSCDGQQQEYVGDHSTFER